MKYKPNFGCRGLFLLLFLSGSLTVASGTDFKPAPSAPQQGYVGAATCGRCHASEFNGQSRSEHAAALQPVTNHPLRKYFFRQSQKKRDPDYIFDYTHAPLLEISDNKGSVDVPIEWAFGSGRQAVTFVSRVNDSLYLEHFFSYYTELSELASTPGQQDMHPVGLAEAAGLYYKTQDPKIGMDGCFQCHSTGPVRMDSSNALQPHELGVRCESCHGPGKLHVEAALRKDVHPESQIQAPSRMTSMEQLRLCGTCHRSPDEEKINWSYMWNVRHEPPYLVQSACFRKSQGKLSCITCHSPHEPLGETSTASYNSTCAQCHKTKLKTCSIDCVSCHMPRVSPQPGLTFTNHWIGIYSAGSKLIPVRRDKTM